MNAKLENILMILIVMNAKNVMKENLEKLGAVSRRHAQSVRSGTPSQKKGKHFVLHVVAVDIRPSKDKRSALFVRLDYFWKRKMLPLLWNVKTVLKDM